MAKADPFHEFREAVSRHVRPLATDFGLGHTVEKVFDFEIHVEFSSASSRLEVAFELGSVPWVYVGVAAGARQHEFGLHTLVEDVEGTFASVTLIERLPSIDAQVRESAELTRRYAATFLKGDHSRVPTLRVLRARAHRDRNYELTGTPTGTPPLDHRPTLSELFAEAHGAELPADVRLACVHSAVWDHEYTMDEVASFLKLSTIEIQRIVDALDNVTDDSLDALRGIVGAGD